MTTLRNLPSVETLLQTEHRPGWTNRARCVGNSPACSGLVRSGLEAVGRMGSGRFRLPHIR